MSRLPVVKLGLLVTVLQGITSPSGFMGTVTTKGTYVTHVGFGTRGPSRLGALSPRRRVTT